MNVKLLTIICKDILLSGRMKVSVGEKDMYRVADAIGLIKGYDIIPRYFERESHNYTEAHFQIDKRHRRWDHCYSIMKDEDQYKLLKLSETDKNVEDVVFVLFMMGILDRDTYCKYFMSVDRILDRVCVVDKMETMVKGIEKYKYYESGEKYGYVRPVVSRAFVDLLNYFMFVAYVDCYWSMVDGNDSPRSGMADKLTEKDLVKKICEYEGIRSGFLSKDLLFTYPLTEKFSIKLNGLSLRQDKASKNRYNYVKTLDYFHDRLSNGGVERSEIDKINLMDEIDAIVPSLNPCYNREKS